MDVAKLCALAQLFLSIIGLFLVAIARLNVARLTRSYMIELRNYGSNTVLRHKISEVMRREKINFVYHIFLLVFFVLSYFYGFYLIDTLK